jgi:hypothetical protein
MRSLTIIAAVLTLWACDATLPHRADTPERRYAVCMKSILGNFADMEPTEARLKAAELCKSTLQSTPALAAP